MQRRKSVDSSDSSDSNDSDSSSNRHGGHVKVKKDKKEKKEKKEKKDKKDKKDKDKHQDEDKSDKKKKDKAVKSDKPSSYQSPAFPQPPSQQQPLGIPVPVPQHHQQAQHQKSSAPMSFGFNDPHALPGAQGGFAPPPSYGGEHPPPPSGYRVPLSTDTAFPLGGEIGYPPLYDADGSSPIFLGSALFENSVHPCKIGPHLDPPAHVPYGGKEQGHHGRYDLLPFVPEQMEWVYTTNGQIPPGRTPIEGGYEEGGDKLYHALGNINGVRVPGKVGTHLGGAHIPFGGEEKVVHECWK
ncbi:hypothetical protein FA15DRAFT_86718 [Coprinopsis marcescibilis]|uniref:Uncharacterized protein n=1 Tax=Coprinopsis marcescibilis TaxID=230819 RepID=A0A5C3L4Y5_COPMA|nr:hypothetical protein FA15DRAFT_86718 [Coprinopsis marcescibilis]